jgi:hypothetical protein
VSAGLDKIRAWFRRAGKSVESVAEGQEPATTPPLGEMDRETSTNAQVEGAVGEPYDE